MLQTNTTQQQRRPQQQKQHNLQNSSRTRQGFHYVPRMSQNASEEDIRISESVAPNHNPTNVITRTEQQQLPPDVLDEVAVIKKLQRALKKMGAGHVVPLTETRVPILKLDTPSRSRGFVFKFDLCVNRPLGVRNSQLIRAYSECDVRFRPLAYLLKQWTKAWKIYNPSSIFTSYCVYLLLIFFLQTRPTSELPNLQQSRTELKKEADIVLGYDCWFDHQLAAEWRSQNSESLGELLVLFFVWFL